MFEWKQKSVFLLQLLPPLLFILVFGIVPLLLVVNWSFWEPTQYWMEPSFTLGAYVDFFSLGRYLTFLKTLRVSVVITLVSLILGYPIAYYISEVVSDRYRNILLFVFVIPFFLSYIVRVFALRLILGRYGIINNVLVGVGLVEQPIEGLLFNEFAVQIGLLSSYLPFMIFPIVMAFGRVSRSTLEASRDLGAGFFQTLRRVIVPLTMPGIFAGCLFVFVMSLGSTVEWDLLGGVGELSTSQMLNSLMTALRFPGAFAVCTLLLVLTMGGLSLGLVFGHIDRLFETLE